MDHRSIILSSILSTILSVILSVILSANLSMILYDNMVICGNILQRSNWSNFSSE